MNANGRHDSDESEGRKSAEHGMSRLSRFFVTDVVRAQVLGWIVKALSNKRVVEKMDGSHSSHMILEHAWIFQFIDIIYVGTIFKLSHLIGLCGRGINVYTLCVSYFAIMFSTRLSFDVYTCISGASGILHLVAFCFYGMGVFVMTVNISSHLKHNSGTHDDAAHTHVSSYGSALTGDVSYGSCERSIDYDTAFAVAFIFTRIVLIIMYGLYFYVFHESNQLGLAPDMGMLASGGLRLSDITRDSDHDIIKELHRASMDSRAHSVDHFRPGERSTSTAAPSGTENPLQPNGTAHTHAHAPTAVPRTSFVMRVTNKYGEHAVKLHFTRIFVLKVAPVILSSLAMCTMFAGVTPVIVLPMVAIIEMVGDFLPSHFIHHAADWRELVPSRHFLEERLGLFFMLVLGEVVLGFSAINYYSEKMDQIYKVLLFSFFSIFTVGMQYFEPLQCYTKPEGPHPLDIQQLNPVYVWLVCLTSFFMLVAGNGMVELYGQVAENDYVSMSDGDIAYQKEKVANGLGSVTILIILKKILDKVYYRERLLPDPLFTWLDSFYKKTEVEQRQRAPSYAPRLEGVKSGGAAGGDGDRLSQDSDFGPGQPLSQHSGSVLSQAKNGTVASSVSAAQEAEDNFAPRQSMRVVPKSEVAMGIRRIRPLTFLRVCVSLVQFLLWPVDGIAVEDYMTCYAALIVFPSLVEVVLEIKNFLQKHREDAEGMQASASKGSLGNHSE